MRTLCEQSARNFTLLPVKIRVTRVVLPTSTSLTLSSVLCGLQRNAACCVLSFVPGVMHVLVGDLKPCTCKNRAKIEFLYYAHVTEKLNLPVPQYYSKFFIDLK